VTLAQETQVATANAEFNKLNATRQALVPLASRNKLAAAVATITTLSLPGGDKVAPAPERLFEINVVESGGALLVLELIDLSTQELLLFEASEIFTPLLNFLIAERDFLNGNTVGVNFTSETNAAGVTVKTLTDTSSQYSIVSPSISSS